MKSIRYRIVSFLLTSLFFINLVSGYYIYRDTQEEIEEIFNAEQAQLARTIEQLLTNALIVNEQITTFSSVPHINDPSSHRLGHHYEKKIAYQVWDLEGNLLLTSENAPLHPLSATALGFSRTEYNNETWHIFSLYAHTAKKWIFTAQKTEVREELITLITRDQLATMLLVSLMIIIVVTAGVTSGIYPIKTLSHEIARKSGNNLSQINMPISKELLPIKQGVNRLLERVNETLTKEKNFSADLSHELKTPLAAIKIHAQNLGLAQILDSKGKRSISMMNTAIDNMSNTIEQLLMLNRMESKDHDVMLEKIELNQLSKDVIAFLPADVHKKNAISLTGNNVSIAGNRSLLGILLRNLIENASKYSDKGSKICVNTLQNNQFAIIEVVDDGPGMTNKQKKNAIKRHYRVSDTQAYGSGLGLSIVKKIVDLHGGLIEFLDKKKGLGLIVKITIKTHLQI